MREELDALWRAHWAETPPVGHALRRVQPERWVRFHSLPDSKRYPERPDEYDTVLDRHRAVLSALGLRGRCFVLVMRFTDELPAPPDPSTLIPEAVLWRFVKPGEDDDLDAAVYAAASSFPSPAIDRLLRAVADEEEVGVVILPVTGEWLYHPYDGGADVIAPSTARRGELAEQFRSWLSPHPRGL